MTLPSSPSPRASAPAQPMQRLDRCAKWPYTPGEYWRRMLWVMVRGTVFRFSPPRAYGWRRMLLRLFGAKLGHAAAVRPSTCIVHPWLLEMGDWSMLADNVTVYNLGAVRIGHHTTVSQGAYLCAGSHDYTRAEFPLLRLPITIGNGVWIAAQAFVGPNVTVADNAVVGARAVVVGDVPEAMVVAGNPARPVKPRVMSDAPPGERA